MNKIMIAALCAASLSTGPALAQSNQGKAGSDNGPTSNSQTRSHPSAAGSGTTMDKESGMSREAPGTVGAGTGSGMKRSPSSQADPNGSPSAPPAAKQGPQGDPSKSNDAPK